MMMMIHGRGRKQQEARNHDWSTLPFGVLDSIAEKLDHFRDRLSLASVCRDWRIPVKPRRFPFTAEFAGIGIFCGTSRSVTITFQFQELCCILCCNRRPYKRSLEISVCSDRFPGEPKLKKPKWSRLLRRVIPPDVADSEDHVIVLPKIEESKSGWLVVSMPYERFTGEECQQVWESLFVYHPFSSRFMNLPEMYPQECYTISFSGSDPTSPECVFIVIVWDDKKFRIRTWSPGQDAWKERHVIAMRRYHDDVRGVAWLDGVFYWCSHAQMESFNPSNGERKEIAFPSQLVGIQFTYNTKLLELNGEIFLLVYSNDRKERINVLFIYYPFEGLWIRRDDFLNDRVLYISYINPSCYPVLVTEEYGDTGWSRVLRNYSLNYDCREYGDLDADTGPECGNICTAWLEPPLETSS